MYQEEAAVKRQIVLGITKLAKEGAVGAKRPSDEASRAKMEVYLASWILEPQLNSQRYSQRCTCFVTAPCYSCTIETLMLSPST